MQNNHVWQDNIWVRGFLFGGSATPSVSGWYNFRNGGTEWLPLVPDFTRTW